MARVIPPLPSFRLLSAGEHAELAILESLSTGLPEAYTLFYQLRWARTHATHDRHSELDVVVVNAAGEVSVNEAGVFKCYGSETKDVAQQAKSQLGAILASNPLGSPAQ